MTKQQLYVCPLEELEQFVVDRDKAKNTVTVLILDQHSFTLLDNDVARVKEGVLFALPSKRVFFDEPPWDMVQLISENEVANLFDFHQEQGIQTPQEKMMTKLTGTFLKPFIIEDIKFRELNPLALQTAVEKIAQAMPGLSVKEKGEKVYLVQEGGDVLDLEGDAFKELIRSSLKGKSIMILDKPANAQIVEMLQRLGIIEEFTLKREKTNLLSMFGKNSSVVSDE